MKKITLTQGKHAIVDDEDFKELNRHKWCANKFGHSFYACRGMYDPKTQKTKTILMHRVILDAPTGTICDHVNRNGLDNRKTNLRFCTKEQNSHNSKINIKNKSGYKGVSWDKNRKKWVVRMKINGFYKFIGRFTDKEKAIGAYHSRARKNHGEFFIDNYHKHV